MMLKALVWVVLSVLLAGVTFSQASTLRDVVVQKSVSVKSPQRQTSVINHFNPAGHIYEATGNVLIDREEKYVAPAPIPVAPPQPKINLDRTVSVKSPEKKEYVNEHFDPAGHIYAATGNVVIDRSPPQVRRTAPSPQIVYSSEKVSAPKPRVSQSFSLEKSVSVKSPQRAASVIDHFNPAGHVYAATGNVLINRSPDYDAKSSSTSKTTFQPIKDIRSQYQDNSLFVAKIPKVSTGLNLERTVSVKSPQRETTVINHFNPTGHQYAATGNVAISRGSTTTSTGQIVRSNYPTPTTNTKTTVDNYGGKSFPSITENVYKPSTVKIQSFSTPKNIQSGLSLEKTVSVKSPDRVSSVISHFTPAQHRYAATGNVVINRASSLGIEGVRKAAIYTPQAQQVRKVEIKKSEPLADVNFNPKTLYDRKPKITTKSITSGPISSSLNLERTVSVKSPERVSSVINHFNPAGHRYAATGNVAISRGSTTGGTRFTSETAFVQPATHVFRTQADVDQSGEKVLPSIRKTIKSVYEPSILRKQSVFTPKSIQSGLNLERTVSVKSPDRVSSVISHFTPAQHRYAATGNVVINRSHSLGLEGVRKSTEISPPVQRIQKFKIAKPETFTDVTYNPKPVSVRKQSVTTKSISSVPSSSSFHLEKSVSVKSPERTSSVINHFNPAGHQYAATGNVAINRVSTLGNSGTIRKNTVTAPIAKAVNSQTTAYQSGDKLSPSIKNTQINTYKSSPLGVQSFSIPKNIQSGLSLERTVSVKSPDRVSSVISHFSPAQHHYSATGNVIINRASSLGLGSEGARKTTVFTPHEQVQKVEIKKSKSSPNFVFSPQPSYERKQAVTTKSIAKGPSTSFNVEKSVSVKSPDRVSSVVDHFNPAGHQYAATGNVAINRGSPNAVIDFIRKTKVSTPTAKVVKIKTDVNRFSLNKETPKTIYQPSAVKLQTVSTPKNIQSGLNLERTVSVKSPDRVSSVIDHFTPAQHKYSATGNVIINRASSFGTESTRKTAVYTPVAQQVQKVEIRRPEPSPVTNLRHKTVYEQKQTVTTKSISSKPLSSSFNLEKSVSVKSPERISSVVDHFNPAGHQYAATGNVAISRGSTTGGTGFIRKSEDYTPASKVVRTQIDYDRSDEKISSSSKKATEISYKPSTVQVQSVSSSKNIQSGLNLERTVSVKSPDRVSSVISHFTPAQHRYAATGNVVINRASSLGIEGVRKIPTYTPQAQQVRIVEVKKPESFPAFAYSPQTSERKQTVTTKSFSSGPSLPSFNLEKTVSVKSPERVSSVVNHFNPADHKYAATGGVAINRGSTTIGKTFVGKTAVTTPNTKIVRIQANEDRSGEAQYPTTQNKIATIFKPSRVAEQSISTSKNIQSGLSLERTVSVKSPERVSSVISHFTPAQHRYAATGSVFINRGSSLGVEGVRKTATYTNQIPQVQKVEITKSQPFSTGSYSPKTGSERKQTVTTKSISPGPTFSSFNLEKSVSVKSPERITSVVNHFNPAGHQYAATGSVAISRGSSTGGERFIKKPAVNPIAKEYNTKTNQDQSGEKQDQSEEEAFPFIKKIETVFKKPSVVRVESVSSPKNIQSGLNLERTVSVKSPERVSSVINHFTPAQHKYAATGSVVINRGTETGYKPLVSKPQVEHKISSSLLSLPASISPKSPSPITPSLNLEKSVSVKSPEVNKKVDQFELPIPQVETFEIVQPPTVKFEKQPQPIVPIVAPVLNLGYLPPVPDLGYLPPLPSNVESTSSEELHSGFNLEKSVSVKSPKRDSSVIDHFNPAEHVYEATGSVSISRSV